MGMPAKPKYTEDCFESKTDEQGWWECKLYEVMNIFGGTLKRGVKTPFYTEMKVPANKTKIDVNLKELLAKAQKEAEFWKGKYATVKLENNALRKKIYNINKGAGRVI